MLLINGKKEQMISIADRGIRFSDGCFTTIAVFNGKIILFSAHLDRLRVTCKMLDITFPYWNQLKNEMQMLALTYGQHRATLNVVITRGSNGIGYNPTSCVEPIRIVRISSWPYYYDNWRNNGIILGLSPIRLGRNPYLAGLKHLNRLEQVLIRAYIEKAKVNEALVLDSNGWIVECCAANIFWRKDNIVYTPYLNQAGVNGIMRQFCLRVLKSSPFHVVEIYAREKALILADEIVICNALMPIVPVRIYKEKNFFSRELFNFLIPFCKNPDLI